jgi:lipopolysaccharide/colanic/teichoic acid biosynthesis glycosyltransferase
MKKVHDVISRVENIGKRIESAQKLSGFVILLNVLTDLSKKLEPNGFEFISRYLYRNNSRHLLIFTKTSKDVVKLIGKDYQLLVSVELINNMTSINEFFAAINNKLEMGGTFICRFKPQEKIEQKLLNTYRFPLNQLIYLNYFVFRRVFPKLSLTRKFYFHLTKGKNRSLRELEVIGRLYASGYELVNKYSAGEYVYLVAKKLKAPFFDKYSSYGLLFKMKRIGKAGKEIFVYKLRTMVPFSEYLQDAFINKNSLAKGGKIHNDSRITPVGRILRKYWIDEIPNLFNLVKGEMKLVGVRPISKSYFDLYTPELQQLRLKVKPGIIPPFYADLPESLDEIQKSEKDYINSYLKNPLRTDIRYFIAAFKNILFKRVRSN